MIELSIEQKAQRYDEAIERAKKVLLDCTVEEQKVVEYITPELKESEWEIIRKVIIEHFAGSHDCMFPYKGFTKEQILAWLDKQCKQKPTVKAGPNFRVGDWITDNNSTFQIARVENEWYYADDGDKICFGVAHQYYHLWTINDAKPGDVILTKNKNIFIFKSISGCVVYDYCGLYFGKFQCYSGNVNNDTAKQLPMDYVPATKEQCDILMQAMADAGYTFDFEKKELKIEQKLIRDVEIPFGAIDSELKEVNYNIPNGYHAEIEDNKVVIKKGEQKPWSEEDDDMLYKVTTVINRLCAEGKDYVWSIKTLKKLFYWLKSLKDRVQPQSQWKPSATEIKVLEEVIDSRVSPRIYHATLHGILERLKKLREE